MLFMAFTVVPLFNTDLPTNTAIAFANCFVLRDLPEWVKEDQSILEGLSRHDRQGIFDAEHSLVAEYGAKAIGEPDPAWVGQEPRSIQCTKSDSAILANLALWLVQPSKVCYTTVLHALSWDVPGRKEQIPIYPENRTPSAGTLPPR